MIGQCLCAHSLGHTTFLGSTWKLVVHRPSPKGLTISSAHPQTLLSALDFKILKITLYLKSRLLLPKCAISRNSWLLHEIHILNSDSWYTHCQECQEIHAHLYQSNVANSNSPFLIISYKPNHSYSLDKVVLMRLQDSSQLISSQ